jgi:hypothetical protein
VVGYFFLAVIGDIRHHAAEFLRTLNVNVVNADAVTNYALDVGERLQNAAGNGGPLHKEDVRATALLNHLVFSLAIRFDFLEGEARSLYNFSLQIDRRENVVRDENGWQLYLLCVSGGRSSYEATTRPCSGDWL